MFFNELEKAYLYYEENKRNLSLLSKLEKRQKRALATINQSVYIRDLVVRTEDPNCYGESKPHTNIHPESSEIRLRAHVSSLFNLANEDHVTRNCERDAQGNFQLKQGNENHITRLSMNEFSLFTKNPLTMEQYQELHSDILAMADELEPNVHVLLSSFAVKDTVGKLLNMSLFVEGGKPPVIHWFSKNTASSVDINYAQEESLFSQQTEGAQVSFHAEHITTPGGETISTGSVFEVTTQGGARYTQAIDVCLDHALGHSKALMERRILSDAAPDEIFPEQVEQCVTSNWIDVISASTISDKVLHADPIRSMYFDHHAHLGSRMLTAEAKHRIIPKEFSSMAIVESETGYQLINPPFGSNCRVCRRG